MDLRTALIMEEKEMEKLRSNVQQSSNSTTTTTPSSGSADLMSFDTPKSIPREASWIENLEKTSTNFLAPPKQNSPAGIRQSSSFPLFNTQPPNEFRNVSPLFQSSGADVQWSVGGFQTEVKSESQSVWQGSFSSQYSTLGANTYYSMTQQSSQFDSLQVQGKPMTVPGHHVSATLPAMHSPSHFAHNQARYSPVNLIPRRSTSPQRIHLFPKHESPIKEMTNSQQGNEINSIFESWLTESNDTSKNEKVKSPLSPLCPWKEWDPLHQVVPPIEKPPELPPKILQQSGTGSVKVPEKQTFEPERSQAQNPENQASLERLEVSATQQFINTVEHIRETLPHNDPFSNPGYLISRMMPKWQSSMTNESSDDTIKISITQEGQENPMVFSCNVNASVEHVLSQALCIAHDDISDVCVTDYKFKVAGKQEFLLRNTTLSLYELVQDCIRFEEDLHLQLVHENSVDRSLIRMECDDGTDVITNMQKLVAKSSSPLTRGNVDVVKNTFFSETQKLQKEHAMKSNFTTGQQCDRIIQSVKATCQVLGEIETVDVSQACNDLRSSIEDDLECSSSDANKERSVTRAMEKLIPVVSQFIDMFCEAADIEHSPRKKENYAISTDIPDFLDVNIVSVHRLPQMWNSMYEEYFISCELYYGDKPLGHVANTTIIKSFKSLNCRVSWNDWLVFPIKVSDLPRETKICITLHGIPKKNDASKPEKISAKELSWTTVQLFNHKNVMLGGGSLHRMISATNASKTDRTSSSISTKIFNNDSMVIHLKTMSSQSKTIMFPFYSLQMLATRKLSSGNSIRSLDEGTQQDLIHVWNKNRFVELTDQERDLLWRHRLLEETAQHPGTLAQILRGVPSWSPHYLPAVYQILEKWPPIPPVEAVELLSASFPDHNVRSFAIRCIQQGSDDEINDYIIQLVQALKYEPFYDNTLARFLLRSALGNIRICHRMYWLFTENACEGFFFDKYKIMLNALDSTIGAKLKKEFEKEMYLVKLINRAAEAVKYAKDSSRSSVLQAEINKINSTTKNRSFRLPTDPSLVSNNIVVERSSYFTSNSIPLKLYFNNVETTPSTFQLMYKVGDDLRQDVLTMQLVKIMDKLWLAEGLDLKIVTFDCLSTGSNRGFIELVPDSITLREIQSSYGLTGAFKDRPISEWLQRHNPTSSSYNKAEEYFKLSCAGYCVATYVLGICDRHNDNIMLRTSGQMFHIDFARFLGHAQMFGNIKRDRAPFVLTADMAYVINGGERPSSRFHDFVDICCQAFNIIRKSTHLFINLLSLMTHSGIAELRQESDLRYVYDALKPAASDSEATAMFTRMIETSLSSSFTRINFFIHNLAQIRFHGGESEDKKSLSFTSKFHTANEDGLITSAVVVGYHKQYNPEKQYLFCVRILRELRSAEAYVFRNFNEFSELHRKLEAKFPYKVPSFPNKVIVGRSQVKQVAEKRKSELSNYLNSLINANLGEYKDDLLCTFFHPILRDEQTFKAPTVTKQQRPSKTNTNTVGGEIKLSIHHKNDALLVMVMHCRNLVSPDGDDPDPYVKSYLLPDTSGNTKRKTKVARKTFNPTYNEMIVYDIPLSIAKTKYLQVSVWNYETLNENDFMGGVNLNLNMLDLSKDNSQWYPLTSKFSMEQS